MAYNVKTCHHMFQNVYRLADDGIPKYKVPKGLRLSALTLVAVGVVLVVVFEEPAGTGVALVGVALL